MNALRVLPFLSLIFAVAYAQLLRSEYEPLCTFVCYFYVKGNNTKVVEGKTLYDFNAMVNQCADDSKAPKALCERLQRIAKNERIRKKFTRIIEASYAAEKVMCEECKKQ